MPEPPAGTEARAPSEKNALLATGYLLGRLRTTAKDRGYSKEMKPTSAWFLWTYLLVFPLISHAADAISCPPTVSVRQDLASSIAGWTPLEDDTPHSLAGITFYDGPPAEKASLVYDRITHGKREQVASWSFAPQRERPIWMTCNYAGTSLQLGRSLPSNITGCSVTYDPQEHIAGLPVVRKITCK